MFSFSKKEHVTRKELKNDIYIENILKEIEMLKKIIEIAYKSESVSGVLKEVSEILAQYYDIDYKSFFMLEDDKMNLYTTNVSEVYRDKLEKEINRIYIENFVEENLDLYILKSENGLIYETAEERKVAHMIFIPMKANEIIGGILIENKTGHLMQVDYELLKVFSENVSVLLNNLVKYKKSTVSDNN